MNSDDLRLIVLGALIARHGPIPCIHVSRSKIGLPLAPGRGPNALGDLLQDYRTVYRCEASELRKNGDSVVLDLRAMLVEQKNGTSITLAEANVYKEAHNACARRDQLCKIHGCLPWDRTALMRPLDPSAVDAVMQHIDAGRDGLTVLPGSTSEISAWTFK